MGPGSTLQLCTLQLCTLNFALWNTRAAATATGRFHTLHFAPGSPSPTPIVDFALCTLQHFHDKPITGGLCTLQFAAFPYIALCTLHQNSARGATGARCTLHFARVSRSAHALADFALCTLQQFAWPHRSILHFALCTLHVEPFSPKILKTPALAERRIRALSAGIGR